MFWPLAREIEHFWLILMAKNGCSPINTRVSSYQINSNFGQQKAPNCETIGAFYFQIFERVLDCVCKFCLG